MRQSHHVTKSHVKIANGDLVTGDLVTLLCMNSQKIIFIVGPTAVGKSEIAYSLAQRFNGEIISCDSMQVYREITIATNKPSREILDSIPHHLIDVVSVREEFDVMRFNSLASEAIRGIHARGRLPIVVGGSGLYMQILLDGIFENSPQNKDLREALEFQAKTRGNQFLYDQLKANDPQAAARIHPNDLRRMVRALEVCMTLQRPISQLQKERHGLWGKFDIRALALTMDRKELCDRINERVEEMFERGIVEEMRKLDGIPLSLTAQGIIGVGEIRAYLKGEYDQEKAKDLMKLNTRQLAKRQLTWFRKEKRLRWIEVKKDDTIEGIVMHVMAQI